MKTVIKLIAWCTVGLYLFLIISGERDGARDWQIVYGYLNSLFKLYIMGGIFVPTIPPSADLTPMAEMINTWTIIGFICLGIMEFILYSLVFVSFVIVIKHAATWGWSMWKKERLSPVVKNSNERNG